MIHEWTLRREGSTALGTWGRMVNGAEPIGFTFEDPIREPLTGKPVNAAALAAWVAAWKIYGDTAIPSGRYRITMVLWPAHGIMVPQLLAVPGYTGILIHMGESSHDTEGCILLGASRREAIPAAGISDCQDVNHRIRAQITAGEADGDQYWITVLNPGAA